MTEPSSSKVVCIRVGDKYGSGYVDRLYRGLLRHTRRRFDFVCLQEEKFPGWWNKLSLFPPKERVVYLDLDLVITANIDFLFDYEGPFCVWKDPWAEQLNTSVMSIAPGYGERIRQLFLANPKAIMREFYGDQNFITAVVKKADFWPADKIKSYKADSLQAGPGEAAIVVFHGDPKPATFNEGWVKDAWN